jgi:hypothetical protein
MKVQALIAAAAIACGSAAFAQQQDTYSNRDHRAGQTAQVDKQDQGKSGSKVGDALHRLGEKTRHAFHRMGDAVHRTASRDRDRSDTRAMGASGANAGDDHGRQARMDDAYANWKAKQEKNR